MTQGAAHLSPQAGRFWRMMFATDTDPLAPARAPEGRFHHDGQRALYLSASPAGCVLATQRYMARTDPPRVLIPLRLTSSLIVDLRDAAAAAHFQIDTTHRAADWQDIRAAGQPAPTWAIADRVRLLQLDGMLYASRSAPDLHHLTLFRWSPRTLAPDGPAVPYPPP